MDYRVKGYCEDCEHYNPASAFCNLFKDKMGTNDYCSRYEPTKKCNNCMFYSIRSKWCTILNSHKHTESCCSHFKKQAETIIS